MPAITRVKLLAPLFLALASLAGWGCESTTVSPWSGQEVTASQLDAELRSREQAETAAAAVEELEAKAALAKIQREAEFAVLKETSASDIRLAQIAHEAQSQMEGVSVDLAASAEQRRATLEAMRSGYAAARADIEAKAGLMGDIAGYAQSVIGSPAVQAAGAANPLIAAVLGLGGIVLGRWTKARGAEQGTATALANQRAELAAEAKKREDNAWDEAKREAAEAQRIADAAWDEASREAERRSLLTLAAKTAA